MIGIDLFLNFDFYARQMHELFHGTTLSRAQQIEADGWSSQPFRGQVTDVAALHGVDVDRVWVDLRARRRFVDGNTRGQVASFATTAEMGDSWAQRAPELRTEALHAAWRLLHPELADDSDAQIDCEIWMLRQQLDDPPAVLTLELGDNELKRCRMGGFHSAELPELDELADMWESLPEIEVPFELVTGRPCTVTEVPRRVRGAVALHLLAHDPDEWTAKAKAGEFGVPNRDRYGQLTWAWADLAPAVVAEQWERRVPVW